MDTFWNPSLFIENAIGDPKVTSSKSLFYDKQGKAWVQERKRFRGTFMEQLELWDFPFDVQVRMEQCQGRVKYCLCQVHQDQDQVINIKVKFINTKVKLINIKVKWIDIKVK